MANKPLTKEEKDSIKQSSLRVLISTYNSMEILKEGKSPHYDVVLHKAASEELDKREKELGMLLR